MQIVRPGQANVVKLTSISRATGAPIDSGTVNFYLQADNGTNAGKWWRGADSSWQAAEAIAGAATHQADGHWNLSIASGAWADGVTYLLYHKYTTAPDVHVPNSDQVLCETRLTIEGIVDGVFDELLSGHTGAGSAGAALSAASSTLGTGARTVTITVDDGTDELENAFVRLTNGAETYAGNTSAAGVIVFSVDDATWTVAITKSGYSFTPTTLVVNGDETQTYSMTGYTLTPSSPGNVTGYLYCYSELGVVEQYVDVELVVYTADIDGYGFDQAVRTSTSDATGLVEFTNLVPGMTYMMRRGTQPVFSGLTGDFYQKYATNTTRWLKFTVSESATSPYELPMIMGADSA